MDGGGDSPAVPGICFGPHTRCEPPVFEKVVPASTTTVECTDGDALPILWKQRLGTLACTVPDCPVADPDVAAGSAHNFAVADLDEPASDNELGGPTEGFALFATDASGTVEKSVSAGVHRKVDGPYEDGTTRRIVPTPDGLLWLAPAPELDGLELRTYTADLERVATRKVVTGGSPRFGDLLRLEDGSTIVVYRHAESVPDGQTPRLLPGVARFGPGGQLEWNQTLLAVIEEADPSIAGLSTTIAGADARGGIALRVTRVSRDPMGSVRPDLVKLDRDGNVVWARELPDSTDRGCLPANAAVTADGGVVLMSMSGTGPVYTVFDALDPDGAALDRVQMEDGLDNSATLFDASGNAFAFFGAQDASYLYVFQRKQPGCTRHRVEAPSCFLASDGMTQLGCDKPSAVFTPSGDLLYGMADSIGVVDLP